MDGMALVAHQALVDDVLVAPDAKAAVTLAACFRKNLASFTIVATQDDCGGNQEDEARCA